MENTVLSIKSYFLKSLDHRHCENTVLSSVTWNHWRTTLSEITGPQAPSLITEIQRIWKRCRKVTVWNHWIKGKLHTGVKESSVWKCNLKSLGEKTTTTKQKQQLRCWGSYCLKSLQHRHSLKTQTVLSLIIRNHWSTVWNSQTKSLSKITGAQAPSAIIGEQSLKC